MAGTKTHFPEQLLLMVIGELYVKNLLLSESLEEMEAGNAKAQDQFEHLIAAERQRTRPPSEESHRVARDSLP